MISICPHCGSYQWNKIATATTITCPDCGNSWPYHQGRLYLLSGCSGVGKTTTLIQLSGMAKDFSVLDADMFYAPDAMSMSEQICRLSATLNQQGQTVLWANAGGLDRIKDTYHRQFFSEINCLALTCAPDELRRRMTEGRGITDPNWIQSSVDYNNYFRTHETIGDTKYEWMDCTGMDVRKVAERVLDWLKTR